MTDSAEFNLTAWDPPDARLIAMVRAGVPLREDADDQAWGLQLRLLHVASESWQHRFAPRYAAGTGPFIPSVPVMRLLCATPWERALGTGRIVLVARGVQLFLVWIGGGPPSRLWLSWGEGPVELHPLPGGARLLATPRLNPADGERSAWILPDADARRVLVPDLKLTIEGDGPLEGGIEPLCLTHPMLGGRLPGDAQDPGWRTQSLVEELIRAYAADDARRFGTTLTALSEDGRGHGRRGPQARRLYRWQRLWVDALVAEIAEGGAESSRRWGLRSAKN